VEIRALIHCIRQNSKSSEAIRLIMAESAIFRHGADVLFEYIGASAPISSVSICFLRLSANP